MPEGPQAVLYAEGTVTYPPEMGIPDQHFVMRSSNHPENGLPDTGQPDTGRPSDEELKEIDLAHGARHEALGQHAEDCPGTDCPLWIDVVG